MTRNGALAGMVAGAVTVILWKQTGSALYEMVPGFIAGTMFERYISVVTRATSFALYTPWIWSQRSRG